MKFCPKCKAAYTDTYETCLHCERVLVTKLKGRSNLGNLISIYKNTDAAPVAFVKDLLKEHSVHYIVKAPNPARSHDAFCDHIEVLVKEQDYQKAQEILQQDSASDE